MGSSMIINALNDELARSAKSTSTDSLNTKNGWILKSLGILEAYAAKEKTILGNEHLTQQGKREALAKLGTETAPQFKWLRNVVEGLEKSDKEYKAKFYTITSALKDSVERVTVHNYVWGKLDSMDSAGRIKRFSEAAQENDIELMAAMLTNPMGAMIPQEAEERILTERAQRLFKQPFENYQQNTYLLEIATTYSGWIARWLTNEVGVEISVIRENFGDEIANSLTLQKTGIPAPDRQPVGVQ